MQHSSTTANATASASATDGAGAGATPVPLPLPISGRLLLLDVLAMALFSGSLLLAAFLQRLRFVLLPQRS